MMLVHGSNSIARMTVRQWGVVWSLGGVALAGVQVSALPNNLAFMLPAVLLVCFGVFSALRPSPDGRRLALWISIVCWAWLLALAVNPTYSIWPEMSIWYALILALIPASVLGLYRWLADDAIWNRLEWLLFCVGGIVAVGMLYQYFVLGKRSDWPFLDANVASAVMYAVALPLFYRFMTAIDRPWQRWLLAAFALLLSTAFFTAFSRAGSIVFGVALAGTLLVVVVAQNRAIVGRFGICLILIGVGFALVHYGPSQTVHRNWNDLSQDNSLDARFMMWHSTWQIYTDAPVLGHGLGTYKQLYPRYRSLQETASSGDMAHEDYLQILAGGGPLLLALLLGFVLAVLFAGIRLLRRIHQTRAGPAKNATIRDVGLCAAILALAAHATANFIFFMLILSFLTGLYAARLAGRYVLVDKTGEDKQFLVGLRIIARPLVGTIALICLVSVSVGAVASYTLKLDRTGSIEQVIINGPRYKTALALRYIDPLNYRARFYIIAAENSAAGHVGPSKQGVKLAIMALNDSRELLRKVKRPDCSVLGNTGYLLTMFNTKKEALEKAGVWVDPAKLLGRTVNILPTCLKAWRALAHVWFERDNEQRGIDTLKTATKWMRIPTVKPHDAVQLTITLAKHLALAGNQSKAVELLQYVIDDDPGNKQAQTLLQKINEFRLD